ncbi:hypothetical protein FXO38_30334 [Capsicum annuum]|nr:hypothetical protein FXO38_30334 [Capsicum annuum]
MFVLHILPHRKPVDGMLVDSSSRSVIGDGPSSPKYSDRLSPAINHYMSEATRQEVRGTPDNEEMENEAKSSSLLVVSGLLGNAVVTIHEGLVENLWSWSEVKFLSESLLMALDASLEHALLGSVMNVDRYAAAERAFIN